MLLITNTFVLEIFKAVFCTNTFIMWITTIVLGTCTVILGENSVLLETLKWMQMLTRAHMVIY